MDENDNSELINELRLKYPPIVVEPAPEPSLNYDINGPRLIIEKIEIENFKSYGGTKILGPFHQNFTCIIGPNGSGKSNVIDALLFVFGFRASKIRSKKLSVLIHKSELFPNVGSCSVRVFFQRIKSTADRNDEYEVIPDSKFVVSRVAFKDNSSVYKINEKKANGKEIVEFLKKQGIDLDHNRFLILQGEVEQIALMKPKAATEYEDGLLEYLEDIIGSNRFKEPLRILYERLEELCELRSDKLNRVKLVAKEKKDLEGIRNEAVKYLRLCNEIVIRKNICFQLKMRDLRQLEVSAIEKQNEVKEELNQIMAEMTTINQLRSEREKELKEAVQNHLIKMQQFDKVQKQFHAYEIEDAQLRDRRKHSRIKIDELSKSIKQKEKDLLKYEKVPEESVQRVEQLTAEIKALEERKLKENENQEKAQVLVKKETLELQKEKDVKSEEFRRQQDLLKTQEAEISSIKCELDFLVGNYKKEEDKYENLKLKLKSIEEKQIEMKEKLNKLNGDLPKMHTEYKETLDEIEKLKNIYNDINSKLDQLRYNFQSGQSKAKEQQIINFLLNRQKNGELKGVIGRLGNLASVDPKYDVAFSTASGRFDSIITADISDAQKCVELLKSHGLHRTAFIGLNKIQSCESKMKIPFPPVPGAQRAFDLLNIPDKSLSNAFYFALRNTLITDNIETARKINEGRNKYRIVTLQGDIAESQGAMTGGGDRQIKGKICLDPSKIHKSGQAMGGLENINHQDLEKNIKENEHKLNDISQRLNYLFQKSERLKNDISTASNNQKSYQDILKNLLVDKAEAEKELVSCDGKLKKNKPDAKQVQASETKIDKLDKQYKKDYENYDKIKKEIDGINHEIKSIGFAKLEVITSVINTILEQIKEKSDTLKKINLSVKNAEKICKRTTAELDRLKTDKTNQEVSFEEMDIKLKAIEVEAGETLKVYQKIDEEVKELVKSKEQLTQQQNQIDEQLQQTKQVQIQINRDFEEKKSKVDQLGQRIKQMQDEIKKLNLHSMPVGVNENDDDMSFMDIVGERDSQINIFSSQKDSHTGTKLKTYSDEELSAFKIHEITYQDLEDKMIKQQPNLTAIEEYRRKEEIYLQRAAELNEITQLRDFQKDQLQKMKQQRHQEFSAGFNLITGKLKEMYQMITMGGDAELELVDSLDPFSEGILFSVRPPKKSWKNISNLSGGEKTLSSLALVFALHHFKPTPFYVMDEIDAALDFKNVSIVANYLKDRTKNAQFIIISLRNNMYELSDRLVGICKPFNVSKTCVVNHKELARCLKSSLCDQSNAKTIAAPDTQNN